MGLEQEMACFVWTCARSLTLGISVLCSAATDPARIYVDFAAAIPSGPIYVGHPVELVATLKVTSPSALDRESLARKGFDPRMTWHADHGSFASSAPIAVSGQNTLPPNGLVFVSRGTYVPPAVPGTWTVSATPKADPRKAVLLTIVVEDVLLKIHPAAVTLAPGQSQPFGITYHGPAGAPLAWSASAGAISPRGLYQAPAEAGIHTVDVRDLSAGRRASALVTISDAFAITPPSVELAPGQSTRFRSVRNQGPVIWSVPDPGGGRIEPDGTYTAPSKPGEYRVLATQPDALRKAEAFIRVVPVSIRITPAATTVGMNQRIQFKATPSRGSCTWSATGGETSEDGLYRAPLTAGTYQVTAQSSLDPGARATAIVTVVPPGLIMIIPEELTLNIGQTQQFTAVGIPPDGAASWSVSPPSAGTITDDGLFTAGSHPGICSIMALLEDSVATVSVNVVETRLAPDPASVSPGGSLRFTAQGLPVEAPVSWTVRPATAGSISREGLFTAGIKPGPCQVSAAAGGVEAAASVQIVSARISPDQALVAPGGTIRFTCDVFGSASPVVTWKLLGEQPGAFLGQDGLYRAPSGQGIYRISATGADGSATQATIVVGPPGGLVVMPEIAIEQEGVYTIAVRLQASNGRTVDGHFTGDFPKGLAHPEIVFPTRRLLDSLGVDGPYTIERVAIQGAVDDESLVFDFREKTGLTEAFSIAEARREWLRIGEISDIRGSDTDGSGLIDHLLVTIPVEVVADGEYRVRAALTTEDGIEIETLVGTHIWNRGTHTVLLDFDGRKIRAQGSTGPLSISAFSVEGPVSRNRDFPGAIQGYDFRMFKP